MLTFSIIDVPSGKVLQCTINDTSVSTTTRLRRWYTYVWSYPPCGIILPVIPIPVSTSIGHCHHHVVMVYLLEEVWYLYFSALWPLSVQYFRLTIVPFVLLAFASSTHLF
jgi:hypothetical protein